MFTDKSLIQADQSQAKTIKSLVFFISVMLLLSSIATLSKRLSTGLYNLLLA